jgi:hypothetical protein
MKISQFLVCKQRMFLSNIHIFDLTLTLDRKTGRHRAGKSECWDFLRIF